MFTICCPLSFANNLVDLNSKYDFVSVYLNGSYLANEMRMRNFLGFIISAENSVKEYPNGYFENLPAGVEQINCSTLKVSTRDYSNQMTFSFMWLRKHKLSKWILYNT